MNNIKSVLCCLNYVIKFFNFSLVCTAVDQTNIPRTGIFRLQHPTLNTYLIDLEHTVTMEKRFLFKHHSTSPAFGEPETPNVTKRDVLMKGRR
jgi:hypothetical protein